MLNAEHVEHFHIGNWTFKGYFMVCVKFQSKMTDMALESGRKRYQIWKVMSHESTHIRYMYFSSSETNFASGSTIMAWEVSCYMLSVSFWTFQIINFYSFKLFWCCTWRKNWATLIMMQLFYIMDLRWWCTWCAYLEA